MKIFLLTFVLVFFTVIGNAEVVKEKQKTYDELMAEFFKVSEELEAEKKETESIKKVGRKLDEIKEILSK